jgi:predicted RND superfamily exporter protein
LFTVMIMVILLGLGIDFSIHLATRFHEEHVAGKSIEQALYHTLTETGKGVITGALTTAIALYTLMIADTKGIFEFGFCSGTGVIVTLLAVLWILPALLAYNATRKRVKPSSEKAHDFSALGRFAERMGQWRFAIIPIIILATAAGIWGGLHLGYEWNFNKLEAKGLRSVELQDEIIDKFKFAISFSLLTANSVEESRELRKQFKEKRLVGEVDDISLWISRPDFEKSKTSLVRLREALAEYKGPIVFSEQSVMTEARAIVEELEANRAILAEELDRLWMNLVEIQALSIIGGQDRVVAKTEQLVATRENRENGLLRKIADLFLNAEQIGDDGINWEMVDLFTQRFDDTLHSQAVRMAQGDEPVTLAMVPEDIRARYTSKTGMDGFLLRVLPKQNLYEKEELELFQEVAAKIHPNVTGTPQMILEMGLATLQEGKLTSLAAVIAILLLLLIDFRRSPLVAGFAFLPLITGTALMLGVLWLFGEKLNYMNTMALPVIIGIGVDDGVHFFHRLMEEGKGSLRRSMTSVGRAMLMTSLTTMVGFGSLMFYLMQGMQSLGFTLFVGVGMCFIVTITLLPALSVLLEDRIIKKKQSPRRHEVTKES